MDASDERPQLEQSIAVISDELQSVNAQLEALAVTRKDLQKRLASQTLRLNELNEAAFFNDALVDDDDVQVVEKDWESDKFAWSARLRSTLHDRFRIDRLRPMQLSAINATMSKRDCVLVMPTGGGKSLCYQAPASISDGITVVISPLVSLMEDQQLASAQYGLECAVINASTGVSESARLMKCMSDPASTLKIVYITPEKFHKSARMKNALESSNKAKRLDRFVIDEIHCASQWGHSYRSDYLQLCMLRQLYPHVPIIGLTATATQRVLDDVQSILGIVNAVILRAGFDRPNLFYEVRPKPTSSSDTIDAIARFIKDEIEVKTHSTASKRKPPCGIVYCLTINDTEEVCKELQRRGVPCAPYHSAVKADVRSRVHRAWLDGSISAVVATVAFGLGIDKPDVRFIVHHSVGKSIEHYYQETGRAGRDGARAHCLLLFRFNDVFRVSKMAVEEKEGLAHLYRFVKFCVNDRALCRRRLLAKQFCASDIPTCNGMCDACANRRETRILNIADIGRQALQIIRAAPKRITLPKMVDELEKRSASSSSSMNLKRREDIEAAVLQLLAERFLKEDFHFTPYSTISYAAAGDGASLLSARADYRIEAGFPLDDSGGKRRAIDAAPLVQHVPAGAKSRAKMLRIS